MTLNDDYRHVPPSHYPPAAGQLSPADIPMARPLGTLSPEDPRSPDPFLLPGLRRSAAWGDLGLIALALVALEVVAWWALKSWLAATGHPIPPEGITPELMKQALVPGLALRAMGTCLIVAVIVRARRLPAASVGLRRRGWLLDVVLGVAGTAFSYAAILVTMLGVWWVWPGIWDEMNENAKRLLELVPRLSPLAFLAVALLIGVYEELLFRGFIMTRLRRATGSWTAAVVLSSGLFTVLHALDQTKGALIIVGVLSLTFSLLTIWRRSIVPAIIAHALFDFSQFLFLDAYQPPPVP